MRKDSESQVLTMYGIYFGLMEYLFMFLCIFFSALGEVVASLIVLILMPLISCMASCKLAFRNKKIVATSSLNRNIIIAVASSYIISYLLIFNFGIFTFVIQAIMFIFVYIYVKKTVNKSLASDTNDSGLNQSTERNYNENSNDELSKEAYTGALIQEYKLEKFDDDNISDFLAMNNLNPTNYVFATTRKNTASVLKLTTQGSALTMRNAIIGYDENRLYMFELSRLSDKKIVNAYTIEKSDIEKFSDMKAFSFHAITLVCKDKDMYIINLSAKARGIPDHKEKVERLIEMYT